MWLLVLLISDLVIDLTFGDNSSLDVRSRLGTSKFHIIQILGTMLNFSRLVTEEKSYRDKHIGFKNVELYG